MAGILKLFYITIIYFSLFLILYDAEGKLVNFFYLNHKILLIFSDICLSLFYITGKCFYDADCEKKYIRPYLMKCFDGVCVCIPDQGKQIFLHSAKPFYFISHYNIVTFIIYPKVSFNPQTLQFLCYIIILLYIYIYIDTHMHTQLNTISKPRKGSSF